MSDITHCATRLRLNIRDLSKTDQEAVKRIKGVIGVMNKGGQFQVIIGSDVASVYNEIMKLGKFHKGIREEEGETGEKKGIVTAVAVNFVNAKAGWAVIFVMGALSLLLVMTEMHYSLVPVEMTMFTKAGDDIETGDLLVEFDIEAVKAEGYDIVTPIIVTNTENYMDVLPNDAKHIKEGETLLTVI